MALADDFKDILDSLPSDWTDLEFDLRIDDETRYIDAAVHLSFINAQPYSRADWHWRVNVAHSFGRAAAPETVMGIMDRLDEEGYTGAIRLREVREGRSEIVQMWGRPESVREEFRNRRAISCGDHHCFRPDSTSAASRGHASFAVLGRRARW